MTHLQITIEKKYIKNHLTWLAVECGVLLVVSSHPSDLAEPPPTPSILVHPRFNYAAMSSRQSRRYFPLIDNNTTAHQRYYTVSKEPTAHTFPSSFLYTLCCSISTNHVLPTCPKFKCPRLGLPRSSGREVGLEPQVVPTLPPEAAVRVSNREL